MIVSSKVYLLFLQERTIHFIPISWNLEFGIARYEYTGLCIRTN
uniref:Uncharacterized protein n=1 Tax=Arundo donax TaxID=35708 RepID=A0A0A9IM81_ARUDO